jgi:hypothetical protein
MRARAVPLSGLLAAALAVGYLLAPPLGTDLSAQVARADFWREYGTMPIDLGWYGGTVQYGYSLVSPALMAWLGPAPAGALAAVASAVTLAALFVRTGAPRPALGGLLGAACFFGNLVSGRVTYALGVAFGLLGLLALTAARPWVRYPGAAAGGLLAAATSPVAGLFAVLAGVSLAVVRWRDRRGTGSAVLFAAGSAVLFAAAAAVPLALAGLLLGTGGWMNISRSDTLHAALTGVAVAVLVPRPAVRLGALLSSAGVVAAYGVHTPVGLNATRLASMFALPVVAACAAATPRRAAAAWLARPASRVTSAVPVLLVVVAGLAVWQPPVLLGDLRHAGDPTARRGYAEPLLAELARRQPVGRVEVPPTREYWESAYVAGAAPLARGWLRQVDLARNRLFFDGSLDAGRYLDWLRDNGVRFVALPDAEPSWVGRREAALIRAGLPYLTEVWRDRHWVLYEVAGSPSIVDGAELVAADRSAVTFDAPSAGDYLVRVRWLRGLRVTGPAGPGLAPAAGGWTSVRLTEPGRYTLTSG